MDADALLFADEESARSFPATLDKVRRLEVLHVEPPPCIAVHRNQCQGRSCWTASGQRWSDPRPELWTGTELARGFRRRSRAVIGLVVMQNLFDPFESGKRVHAQTPGALSGRPGTWQHEKSRTLSVLATHVANIPPPAARTFSQRRRYASLVGSHCTRSQG